MVDVRDVVVKTEVGDDETDDWVEVEVLRDPELCTCPCPARKAK
jgi:hypothetical protein